MNIGMIGLGNMGTTMGDLIARNGHAVTGWDIHPEVVNEINSAHVNTLYLKGVPLHHRLSATGGLPGLLSATDLLFIAIPSIFIESTLKNHACRLKTGAIAANLAKGINAETGETAFQLLGRLCPKHRRAMVSGPSVANEIARGMPTVVAVAGKDEGALAAVRSVLDNERFKCILSDDEAGVELGGILKNIYAIGLGILDGKKVTSINFRSVFLTLALGEIADVGTALGARRDTFCRMAGLGDLFATSLSEHSHNRRLGEFLAQGQPLEEIRLKMGILPEGYNTMRAVLGMAGKKGFKAPLAQSLNDFIEGNRDIDKLIQAIFKISGRR